MNYKTTKNIFITFACLVFAIPSIIQSVFNEQTESAIHQGLLKIYGTSGSDTSRSSHFDSQKNHLVFVDPAASGTINIGAVHLDSNNSLDVTEVRRDDHDGTKVASVHRTMPDGTIVSDIPLSLLSVLPLLMTNQSISTERINEAIRLLPENTIMHVVYGSANLGTITTSPTNGRIVIILSNSTELNVGNERITAQEFERFKSRLLEAEPKTKEEFKQIFSTFFRP